MLAINSADDERNPPTSAFRSTRSVRTTKASRGVFAWLSGLGPEEILSSLCAGQGKLKYGARAQFATPPG